MRIRPSMASIVTSPRVLSRTMKLTACPKRYFLETLLSAFRLNEPGLESVHAEV